MTFEHLLLDFVIQRAENEILSNIQGLWDIKKVSTKVLIEIGIIIKASAGYEIFINY